MKGLFLLPSQSSFTSTNKKKDATLLHLTTEQLSGIWCLKYLWGLIYTPLILLKWWLQKWEIKHYFQ